MKIILVRSYGTEVNLKNYNLQEVGIATALVEEGYECDILYYTKDKMPRVEEMQNGKAKIKLFFSPAINILKNAIYLKLLFSKFFDNYDIIQASEYNQIMTVLLSIKYPKKVVLYHGPYYESKRNSIKLLQKIYDFLFINTLNKNLKSIISKSKLATDYLENKGLKNIQTLGIGLNEKNFSSGEGDVPYKKNENEKILLFVGQLDERKNVSFMLKIMKYICKTHLNYKLILIGDGKENDLKRYNEYIDEHNLRKNIHFQGKIPQKEIKNFYKIADAFLLPSTEEIFGMVLLESMYFGVPVFSSLNGGSSMVIKDKENGFIFEHFNEKIWAEEILKILENNSLKNKISLNAQEKIKNNFLWKHKIKDYINVYEDQEKEK
jgi:glycosyltransferase involved in cell wall biosynthesis